MQKIWNYIKSFNLRDWFLILFSLFVSIAAVQIYFSDRTKIISVVEERDSFKNKVGEDYKAKTVLIQSIEDLKKRNDSISLEYNKIKSQDPLVISKTVTLTKIDSIEIPTTISQISPNEYQFNWKYSERTDENNYFNIDGVTKTDSLFRESSTLLKKMELGADLKLDVISSQADNALRIIARSNNPRVSITNIEGSVIDPTKNKTISSYFPQKHWGLGIYGGLGAGFDIPNKHFSVGPQIGIGVTYNIITWK